MRRTIWFGLLAAALAVSLGTTGCRRRPKTGAGIGDDMIGPDAGIGAMGEHGLAYRPEGGLDIITSVSFSPVYFEYDSAQVSDSQRAGIEAVADYVREGARRFPDDGGMAWNAGATLAYEITQFVPRDEAEKYEAEAQPYFARAIELGAAPEWMVLSTADKLSKLGQKERAVEQLLRLLPTIDDEATRLLMIQRLEELRAEADYEGLVQTLETLSARHQAEFPYVPFDFYLVLGPAEISAPFPDALLDLLEREPRP